MELNDGLISIIVPVYNVEQYLSRCIESLINQTYEQLQIILVDDGSTDTSGEICDNYEKKDRRIAVIHKENGGLSDARNTGLKFAVGSYIGFVDSDDWVELDMYELLLDKLLYYKADIAMCGADSVDSEGKRFSDGRTPGVTMNGEVTVWENEEIMKQHLSNKINAGVWNKLYKRSVIEGIEFPSNRLYEDVFTTYKFLHLSSRFVKINSHKYNYFQRDNSICKSKFTEKNFDSVFANEERYNFIKKNYPELEHLARNTVLINLLNLGFRLVKEKCNDSYMEKVKEFTNKYRHLSLDGCNFNFKQKMGLRLMRIDIRVFSFFVRIIYE